MEDTLKLLTILTILVASVALGFFIASKLKKPNGQHCAPNVGAQSYPDRPPGKTRKKGRKQKEVSKAK